MIELEAKVYTVRGVDHHKGPFRFCATLCVMGPIGLLSAISGRMTRKDREDLAALMAEIGLTRIFGERHGRLLEWTPQGPRVHPDAVPDRKGDHR